MLISGNDRDFKYVMQDIEKLYFGAKYSYKELMEAENVPFKFKTVIEKYLLDDIEPETTLESHLFYMTQDSFSCRSYKQLKARVRTSQYKKIPKDGEAPVYREKVYTMRELASLSPEEKKNEGILIREIIVSKLALFSFSI